MKIKTIKNVFFSFMSNLQTSLIKSYYAYMRQ